MSTFIKRLKKIIRAITPAPLLHSLLSLYHLSLAHIAAFWYGNPSKKLIVIGVTGTKGKSSTLEFLNAAFEEAGNKTALIGTVRIKIGEKNEPNLMRMSMPGRFYLQRFLSDAVKNGCDIALLEMTSEGARQHRHRGIHLDALVFTNLAPEHIESHGSLEAYANSKFELARGLARSKKKRRAIIANHDDEQGARYLTLNVEEKIPFSLSHVTPWGSSDSGGFFTFEGIRVEINLAGEFSLKNALAAALTARAFGISKEAIVSGYKKLSHVPGRAEEIREGQNFKVVVDYAHTPDSLEALYKAYSDRKKICVVGSTGGGRDTWKRPVMGKISSDYCENIIITNEDPYDEDPKKIAAEIASGMTKKPEIIMDRRKAIAHAFSLANEGDVVLLTGKGTDPCICGPNGSQIPWSDAQVARDELRARI